MPPAVRLPVVSRPLSLVPAPGPVGAAVLDTVVPALRACLDGERPLAVLPAGPPAVVDAARAVLRPEEPVEDGADLVVVTSGSTGSGRAVLLSAEALRASAAATAERLDGEGSWLLALPVSAIAGLQVVCRGLLAGRAPVVLENEPLADAAARLPGGDRQYVSLVPTQLRRWLDAEPDVLRGFDAVLVGGAATDSGLLARARAEDVRVVTTYGMTETAGGCVYDGVPLAGVGVRLTDGVELSGPMLAVGYRCDPAATAAAFADGWFRTLDAGTLDADGRLTVHGRLDDVVISGGVKVPPVAVEQMLVRHPWVLEVGVVGMPDEEWGERVTAVVRAAPGVVRPDPGVLRDLVEPRAWAPRGFVEVTGPLPALPNGKPDRRALARLAAGR
jgi:o-succinylbenzoate---CoA ligase